MSTLQRSLAGSGLAAALAVVLACPAPAAAAELALGSRTLVVEPAPLSAGPQSGPRLTSSLSVLEWRLVDRSGSETASGELPGSLGLGLEREVGLARNPVTGDVFALHAGGRGLSGAGSLAASPWGGASFLDPVAVPTGGGEVLQPILAFLPSGDAVVAWLSPDGATALRIEHLALSPAGVELLSLSQVAEAEAWLRPAGRGVQVPGGLGHVAVDAGSEQAFLFLAVHDADETGAGSDEVGILGVDLAVLEDIWGGSAAPVPVTIVPSGLAAPLGDDSRLGRPGRRSTTSWSVDYERHEVLGHDVYAWSDGTTLRAVAFQDGRAGELVAVDADGGIAQLLETVSRSLGGARRSEGPGRRAVR